MIKLKNNRKVHEFLLTFFEKKEHYDEKELNGFWLVKSFNGVSKNWQVSIYTKESFKNYKEYKK